MSSGLLVTLEIALVLGGVLALAVWELVRLRRERKAGEAAEAGPVPTSVPKSVPKPATVDDSRR